MYDEPVVIPTGARAGVRRAVCVHRPIEDSTHIGDGRRAARAVARRAQVRQSPSWTSATAISPPCWTSRPRSRKSYVQLLLGVRFPEVVGFQKDAVQHTFIVPPEKRRP